MKFKIKLYIVEDELIHSKYIKDNVTDYFRLNSYFDAEIIELVNYRSLYNNLSSFSFADTDLFILDIHLNTFFSGIDFAKEIRKYNDTASIIFLTSDKHKSIESINSGTYPIGYLVKTDTKELVMQEQLFILLKNYELLLLNRLGDENTVSFKSNTGNIFVNSNDIIFICTAVGFQKKTIVTTSHREFLCNERIIDMKKKLPQKFFFKGLRSYIINISKIEYYDKKTQLLFFKNNITLFLGPKLIKQVTKYLKDFKFKGDY